MNVVTTKAPYSIVTYHSRCAVTAMIVVMKSKQLPFWNAVSIVALTVVTGIVVAYVALLIVASP